MQNFANPSAGERNLEAFNWPTLAANKRDYSTLVCTLCGTAHTSGEMMTALWFYTHRGAHPDKQAHPFWPYFLLVCTSNAECKAAPLSNQLQADLLRVYKHSRADSLDLDGKQMALVIKATQRMLTAAEGGKSMIIDPKQLCCCSCEWKMKTPEWLQKDGDAIWVFFEGDEVKWFCNSYPCRQAMETGKSVTTSLLSRLSTTIKPLTVPAGSELERSGKLPTGTTFSKDDCSASIANTL
jgi:hypothetical protein